MFLCLGHLLDVIILVIPWISLPKALPLVVGCSMPAVADPVLADEAPKGRNEAPQGELPCSALVQLIVLLMQ